MKSRDVNDTLREHGTEGLRQALDKAPRKGGESSGDSRRQQHERNTRHSEETLILPSPKQPFEVAKVFLREFATHDDGLLKARRLVGVERIALAPRRCTRSAPRALSASRSRRLRER